MQEETQEQPELTMAEKWEPVDRTIELINKRKAKKQKPCRDWFEKYVDKTFNKKV